MEVGGDKAKLRKARGVHEIKTGEKLQSVGALSKMQSWLRGWCLLSTVQGDAVLHLICGRYVRKKM